MKRIAFITAIFFLALAYPLQGQGLFADEAERAKFTSVLEQRRATFGSHCNVLDAILAEADNLEEKDALLFLLSSSTLADLVDQAASFHIARVREALHAKRSMPWGRQLPNDLFLHFVLPPRSGNEIIDSARPVMQRELFPRIKKMNMRDAVLEINHWCNEHVTYQPSDARTSSPLATIRTAHGRCGEESVLTVAALRAAGIPARQCYTPRWAHSDDNHAWVEVWVDGAWHFLGACEPAPDLDQAWFTGPARRTMLTATTVHGRYLDHEEVIFSGAYSTRINSLPWYAQTRRVIVEMMDIDGKPIDDGIADFCVFNYAEFYPVASIPTGADGRCSFVTGLGDILVWARSGHRHAHAVAQFGASDTIRMLLTDHQPGNGSEEMDIVPPAEQNATSQPHPAAEACSRRIMANDSLRNIHVSGFIDSAAARRASVAYGLPVDSSWSVLHRSAGNWPAISALLDTAARERLVLLFPLLSVIADKDLRDASATTLLDHLRNAPSATLKDDTYIRYVLNPRIRYEELRPWRTALTAMLPAITGRTASADPEVIVRWVRDSIRTDKIENWAGISITPEGSLRCRRTDPVSRDILFVALCRTAGIPARIDPVTITPQYQRAGAWVTAVFDDRTSAQSGTARLRLLPPTPPSTEPPQYARQYTLARYDNGRYITLDFEDDERLRTLPAEVDVEAGDYMLVTGIRRQDGSVPAIIERFTLNEGSTSEHQLRFREAITNLEPLGSVATSLLPDSAVNGCVLLWLEPGTEPTAHVLNEISALRSEFDRHAVPMFAIVHGKRTDINKNPAELPQKFSSFTDKNSALLVALMQTLHLGERIAFPLVVVVDEKGSVLLQSSGYTIGIGARIHRVITAMQQ